MNINPEVSEKRFKETLISLNHNNRKRSGFNSGKIQVKTPEKEFLPELFRHFFQVFFRHVQVKVQPVMPEFFR